MVELNGMLDLALNRQPHPGPGLLILCHNPAKKEALLRGRLAAPGPLLQRQYRSKKGCNNGLINAFIWGKNMLRVKGALWPLICSNSLSLSQPVSQPLSQPLICSNSLSLADLPKQPISQPASDLQQQLISRYGQSL